MKSLYMKNSNYSPSDLFTLSEKYKYIPVISFRNTLKNNINNEKEPYIFTVTAVNDIGESLRTSTLEDVVSLSPSETGTQVINDKTETKKNNTLIIIIVSIALLISGGITFWYFKYK